MTNPWDATLYALDGVRQLQADTDPMLPTSLVPTWKAPSSAPGGSARSRPILWNLPSRK
jgi:hypothetical protein